MHSMVSQYVPPRGCVKCGNCSAEVRGLRGISSSLFVCRACNDPLQLCRDCAKMFMPESHTKELDELKAGNGLGGNIGKSGPC